MTCGDDHAPDGSPVGLYVILPPEGEPEIIHAAVPGDAEILELGCGAGRLTHALLALGHPIVPVDQSPEMLSHVKVDRKVEANIETLDLGRTFPVVLLASHLVNTSDDDERRAFLSTSRRHLAEEGILILQRLTPTLAQTPQGPRSLGTTGISAEMRRARLNGRVLSGVVRYTFQQHEWIHKFKSRLLNDEEVEKELATVALVPERWLDPDKTWLAARPARTPIVGASRSKRS